jgi:hypothetical protein
MRQILLQKLRMKEYDQKQKTLANKKKKKKTGIRPLFFS